MDQTLQILQLRQYLHYLLIIFGQANCIIHDNAAYFSYWKFRFLLLTFDRIDNLQNLTDKSYSKRLSFSFRRVLSHRTHEPVENTDAHR